MKPVLSIMMLSVLLISCKKGKTLKHAVDVQFITTANSGVYPEDYFPPFDPNDPNESWHSPNYAHDYSTDEIASRFNSKLISYLDKNKVILQNDTADYVLVITAMNLSESLNREGYIDSCSFGTPVNYVYYSSLRFVVSASLYRYGILVGSWTEEGNSWDKLKSKTDECNAPKVRGMYRETMGLVQQVSKELRVRVSKKLFELEN
jgi:hypothetical protein